MVRKIGRPRLGKTASDHFNTRLDPHVKRKLERAAKRNERTLSKEIQERLRASVETARVPTSQQAAELIDVVSEVLTVFLNAETKKDSDPTFDWRRHAFDREALKIAIGLVLDQLGARGAPGPSRFTLFDTTPADAARTAASAATVLLKHRQ